MVRSEATWVELPDEWNHLGRRSCAREAFLHHRRSLVGRRHILPEEIRNPVPNRVFEQDSLGAYKTQVSLVLLSGIMIYVQLVDFFRLPELVDELQNLVKKTEVHLHKLPKPPPENPVAEIIELVSGFSRVLSNYIEGTPDKWGIHQRIRPLHMKFNEAIKKTAPDFRPYKADGYMGYIPPSFLAAEKEESGSDDGAIYVDQVMNLALQ